MAVEVGCLDARYLDNFLHLNFLKSPESDKWGKLNLNKIINLEKLKKVAIHLFSRKD